MIKYSTRRCDYSLLSLVFVSLSVFALNVDHTETSLHNRLFLKLKFFYERGKEWKMCHYIPNPNAAAFKLSRIDV